MALSPGASLAGEFVGQESSRCAAVFGKVAGTGAAVAELHGTILRLALCHWPSSSFGLFRIKQRIYGVRLE